jgi:hypothetical protein
LQGYYNWCAKKDLNFRPTVYETGALTAELLALYLVRLTGFKPTTYMFAFNIIGLYNDRFMCLVRQERFELSTNGL